MLKTCVFARDFTVYNPCRVHVRHAVGISTPAFLSGLTGYSGQTIDWELEPSVTCSSLMYGILASCLRHCLKGGMPRRFNVLMAASQLFQRHCSLELSNPPLWIKELQLKGLQEALGTGGGICTSCNFFCQTTVHLPAKSLLTSGGAGQAQHTAVQKD